MSKKKSLIIDASCIVALLRLEPLSETVIQKAKEYEFLSPDCLPYEIGNCLSKLLKRNLISATHAVKLFELFNKLPVKFLDCKIENALSLAAEEKHYIYDMFYLECALRTGSPLFTFDEELMDIAKKRGVQCL